MKTFKDVQLSDWTISLTKLTDKKIADIEGYVSMEFGDPVMKITNIIFEDGTKMSLNGEHDIAYIESYEKQISEKQLRRIHDTDPDNV